MKFKEIDRLINDIDSFVEDNQVIIVYNSETTVEAFCEFCKKNGLPLSTKLKKDDEMFFCDYCGNSHKLSDCDFIHLRTSVKRFKIREVICKECKGNGEHLDY